MGLLSGIIGNASEIKDLESVERNLEHLLVDGENIKNAFKLVRDMYIFTNHRLILIDKQGVTGKKVDYHSIPYRSITHFAIETAGHFDLDSEMKIWISSSTNPIIKELKRGSEISGIQKALATGVLSK